MSYPELSRRAGFAAKLEVTPGTDIVPTAAADAIRLLGATDPETGYLAENSRADMWTGTLGQLAPAGPGARYHRFSISFVPIGAGAAYSASVLPECAAILRAAGFSQAVVTTPGSETVTFSVNDDPRTTLTCQLEISGKKYKTVYTIVESLSMALNAANFPIVRAQLVGIAVAPTELALEAHTYDNVDLPIWKGASSFAVGAFAPTVRSANLNLNLESTPRLNANAADGHAGYIITRRRPSVDFMAEAVALSTWDPFTDWSSTTPRSLALIVGATQYKRVKLNASEGRYSSVREQDDNGMRVFNAELAIATPPSGAELDWVFD